ncbi:hypothetical protein B0H14DRAFT_2560372 [Mycena olivaceomarginata]|nr:hypothetical protein B0H14DRAFT_2560372 [Mycena olivaceomarginata]
MSQRGPQQQRQLVPYRKLVQIFPMVCESVKWFEYFAFHLVSFHSIPWTFDWGSGASNPDLTQPILFLESKGILTRFWCTRSGRALGFMPGVAYRWRRNRDHASSSKIGVPQSQSGSEVPRTGAPLLSRAAWNTWYTRLRSSPGILAIFAGLFILFAINIIFLGPGPGESVWTFGQILAMLLLVLPVRDVLEILLARYGQQREEERTVFLTHATRTSWENAMKVGGSPKTILDLFQTGADVNQKLEDPEFASALQVATYRAEKRSVHVLLTLGADPNVRSESISLIYVRQCFESRTQPMEVTTWGKSTAEDAFR